MKKPPPIPALCGWTTPMQRRAATAASTALPPSRITSLPICEHGTASDATAALLNLPSFDGDALGHRTRPSDPPFKAPASVEKTNSSEIATCSMASCSYSDLSRTGSQRKLGPLMARPSMRAATLSPRNWSSNHQLIKTSYLIPPSKNCNSRLGSPLKFRRHGPLSHVTKRRSPISAGQNAAARRWKVVEKLSTKKKTRNTEIQQIYWKQRSRILALSSSPPLALSRFLDSTGTLSRSTGNAFYANASLLMGCSLQPGATYYDHVQLSLGIRRLVGGEVFHSSRFSYRTCRNEKKLEWNSAKISAIALISARADSLYMAETSCTFHTWLHSVGFESTDCCPDVTKWVSSFLQKFQHFKPIRAASLRQDRPVIRPSRSTELWYRRRRLWLIF